MWNVITSIMKYVEHLQIVNTNVGGRLQTKYS